MENTNELYHYGVKGMKWGVRKKRPENVERARTALKSAKDARTAAGVNKRIAQGQYNDAFNRASRYSERHPVSQFVSKKNRLESDKLWDEAENRGKASNAADRAYKQANKKYKQAKQAYSDAKTSARYNKYGLDVNNTDHVINVSVYGYKGAQRIKNRMEKKGMSDLSASLIETGRQTATGVLAGLGVLTVVGAVAKYSSPTAQILDASGKVIKNLYN